MCIYIYIHIGFYIVCPCVFVCFIGNCFLNCLPPNHFLTVFPIKEKHWKTNDNYNSPNKTSIFSFVGNVFGRFGGGICGRCLEDVWDIFVGGWVWILKGV